jgi:hypothetical protein
MVNNSIILVPISVMLALSIIVSTIVIVYAYIIIKKLVDEDTNDLAKLNCYNNIDDLPYAMRLKQIAFDNALSKEIARLGIEQDKLNKEAALLYNKSKRSEETGSWKDEGSGVNLYLRAAESREHVKTKIRRLEDYEIDQYNRKSRATALIICLPTIAVLGFVIYYSGYYSVFYIKKFGKYLFLRFQIINMTGMKNLMSLSISC